MGGRVKKSTVKRLPLQVQLDLLNIAILATNTKIENLTAKHSMDYGPQARGETLAREPKPVRNADGHTVYKASTLAGYLRKAMCRMQGISVGHDSNVVHIYTYWRNKQHIKIHVTDKEYIMTFKMRNGVEHEERYDFMTQAAASATSCAMFYAMDIQQ